MGWVWFVESAKAGVWRRGVCGSGRWQDQVWEEGFSLNLGLGSVGSKRKKEKGRYLSLESELKKKKKKLRGSHRS